MERGNHGGSGSIANALRGTEDSEEEVLQKIKKTLRSSKEFLEWVKIDRQLENFMSKGKARLSSVWSAYKNDKRGCMSFRLFDDLSGPKRLFRMKSQMVLRGGRDPALLRNVFYRWVRLNEYLSDHPDILLGHGTIFGEGNEYEFYIDYTNSGLIWMHKWPSCSKHRPTDKGASEGWNSTEDPLPPPSK